MAELITRKENSVGWVIFSNPTKFNAVSHDMWMALPKAIAAHDADPEVRLIVITGDGDKAFISGADISQFEKARGSAEAQEIYNRAVIDAYEAPGNCSKPVTRNRFQGSRHTTKNKSAVNWSSMNALSESSTHSLIPLPTTFARHCG